MTATDDKYEKVSKEIAALQAQATVSDADKKKVEAWTRIDTNARAQLNEYGWASEPAPSNWKGKLLESFADAGSSMVAGSLPPRYIREQYRQDVKAQALAVFEKEISNDNTAKPAKKTPGATM